MEQFIQYLYEYENGERVRNLGFMKVEHQMDKSVVRIYAKQIDEIKGILFGLGAAALYASVVMMNQKLRAVPTYDKTIMQLAIFEILYVEDVPTGVAISEAVRLAKLYDGDDTGSFVNGILGAFARGLTSEV